VSTKLERLIYIAARIGEGTYPSAGSFAEQFEVSKRTILDDIQFLEIRMNAPIAYSRSHGGYYFTDPHWSLTKLPITEGQLLAFFLSIELAEQYLGTDFEKPLRDAIEHITELLPHEVQLSLRDLISHYSVRSGAAARTPTERLLVVQRALQRRHPLEIVYFTASRGEETQRVIHPYHLFNMQGEWHVVAYDLLRHNIRQFALQRMRQWRVLEDETFAFDPLFSPDEYFEQSFQAVHGYEVVHVELQFDNHQARYIRERIWHPSQRIEERPDGGAVLHFETGAIDAVKRWAMSYGRHVRVRTPESLAQAIMDEFRAGLAEYEKKQ